MRYKSFRVLSFGIILILSCRFISDKSDNEDNLFIQEQIEATSNAQLTTTAEIEKAVGDALTASAPPSSDTPTSTDTPAPTYTLAPTSTPTINPTPSVITTSGDCKNENGNIEFRNNTGQNATIEMVMKKSGRTCAYSIILVPGTSYFWFEVGRYQITITVCDRQILSVTSHISSNWWFTLKESWCENIGSEWQSKYARMGVEVLLCRVI